MGSQEWLEWRQFKDINLLKPLIHMNIDLIFLFFFLNFQYEYLSSKSMSLLDSFLLDPCKRSHRDLVTIPRLLNPQMFAREESFISTLSLAHWIRVQNFQIFRSYSVFNISCQITICDIRFMYGQSKYSNMGLWTTSSVIYRGWDGF